MDDGDVYVGQVVPASARIVGGVGGGPAAHLGASNASQSQSNLPPHSMSSARERNSPATGQER